MEIVWDEPKRLANIEKRGLDFADLTEAFFANGLFLPSKKGRWRGIGANARGVICVVSPSWAATVSVISMRPASAIERRFYVESLKKE